MKRLWILLILPLILLVTGCNDTTIKEDNKGNKIEITDKGKEIKTTFTYDKKIGFSEISTYNNDSPTIEFDCVKLDVDFQM